MTPTTTATRTRRLESLPTCPPTVVFGVLLDRTLMEWPGRNQLMTALSKHAPVVLLQETPAADRRLGRMPRPRLERLGDNIYVVRCALAIRTHRIWRRLGRPGAWVDGVWLRRVLRRAGMVDPLLWLTVNDPSLRQGFPRSRLVYDCMDPNFLPERQTQFDRLERANAERAKVVFASAQSLHLRMKSVNTDSYLLPNAAPSALPNLDRKAEVPGRQPVVGYMGTVDWRFDPTYLLAAARALPAVSFVVVGRVNRDQEHRVSALRSLPNVRFTGQVDLPTGDALVSSFDVGVIPFVPGPTSDAINPVKMYMYLAHGIPVVASDIAEGRSTPWVDVAEGPNEFAVAVERALVDRDPERRAGRRAFAEANTWDVRAERAVQVLENHGLWSRP